MLWNQILYASFTTNKINCTQVDAHAAVKTVKHEILMICNNVALFVFLFLSSPPSHT